MQSGGVVVNFALIQPLQARAGFKDGERKVPIDEISWIPAEAILYLCSCFSERGDFRAISCPVDVYQRQLCVVSLKGDVAGESCVWAGVDFA